MTKRQILVIGETERLRRRVASLLGTLPGLTVTQLDNCIKTDAYFNEHRIDSILLEYKSDFHQKIEHIHQSKPAMPVVLYGDKLSHEQTREAFLCGAADALSIGRMTSDSLCTALERVLDPLSNTADTAVLYQTRSVKNIANRGRLLERQLLEGNPPPFYMNGN